MIAFDANMANNDIRYFNNVWSDPSGTMDDFSDTTPGQTDPWTLHNNVYYNGGNALPEDGNELVNPSDDVAAIVGDPVLDDPADATIPTWNSSAGQFTDGSQNICEARWRRRTSMSGVTSRSRRRSVSVSLAGCHAPRSSSLAADAIAARQGRRGSGPRLEGAEKRADACITEQERHLGKREACAFHVVERQIFSGGVEHVLKRYALVEQAALQRAGAYRQLLGDSLEGASTTGQKLEQDRADALGSAAAFVEVHEAAAQLGLEDCPHVLVAGQEGALGVFA